MEIYPTDDFPGSAQLWAQLFRASSLVFNLTVTETSSARVDDRLPTRTAQLAQARRRSTGRPTRPWPSLAISPWSSSGVAFYGVPGEPTSSSTSPGTSPGRRRRGRSPPATPTRSPGYAGEPAVDLVRRRGAGRTCSACSAASTCSTEPRARPGRRGASRAHRPNGSGSPTTSIENYRRNVARSVAAHEVGHLLTFRWIVDGNLESRGPIASSGTPTASAVTSASPRRSAGAVQRAEAPTTRPATAVSSTRAPRPPSARPWRSRSSTPRPDDNPTTAVGPAKQHERRIEPRPPPCHGSAPPTEPYARAGEDYQAERRSTLPLATREPGAASPATIPGGTRPRISTTTTNTIVPAFELSSSSPGSRSSWSPGSRSGRLAVISMALVLEAVVAESVMAVDPGTVVAAEAVLRRP